MVSDKKQRCYLSKVINNKLTGMLLNYKMNIHELNRRYCCASDIGNNVPATYAIVYFHITLLTLN